MRCFSSPLTMATAPGRLPASGKWNVWRMKCIIDESVLFTDVGSHFKLRHEKNLVTKTSSLGCHPKTMVPSTRWCLTAGLTDTIRSPHRLINISLIDACFVVFIDQRLRNTNCLFYLRGSERYAGESLSLQQYLSSNCCEDRWFA